MGGGCRLCAFALLTILNAGQKLYDSAAKLRLPDFPAFALECLPNRNSLVYGDLYGIAEEASTIFRGTLRYEGKLHLLGFIRSSWLKRLEFWPMAHMKLGIIALEKEILDFMNIHIMH